MNKDKQKKLVKELLKASNEIYKGKEFIPADYIMPRENRLDGPGGLGSGGYIFAPYIPLNTIEPMPKIMKVKEWLNVRNKFKKAFAKSDEGFVGSKKNAQTIEKMTSDFKDTIDEFVKSGKL